MSKRRKASRSTSIGLITVMLGVAYLIHYKRPTELQLLLSLPLVINLAVSSILVLAGITLWRNWRISFALYVCALFASFTHAAFTIIFVVPSFLEMIKLMAHLNNGLRNPPFLSLVFPALPLILEVVIISTCISGLVISYHKRRGVSSIQRAQTI